MYAGCIHPNHFSVKIPKSFFRKQICIMSAYRAEEKQKQLYSCVQGYILYLKNKISDYECPPAPLLIFIPFQHHILNRHVLINF